MSTVLWCDRDAPLILHNAQRRTTKLKLELSSAEVGTKKTPKSTFEHSSAQSDQHTEHRCRDTRKRPFVAARWSPRARMIEHVGKPLIIVTATFAHQCSEPGTRWKLTASRHVAVLAHELVFGFREHARQRLVGYSLVSTGGRAEGCLRRLQTKLQLIEGGQEHTLTFDRPASKRSPRDLRRRPLERCMVTSSDRYLHSTTQKHRDVFRYLTETRQASDSDSLAGLSTQQHMRLQRRFRQPESKCETPFTFL